MATHRLRRVIAVPTAPVAAPVAVATRLRAAGRVAARMLAGCSRPQTNQIYQPGPGITVRDGGVYVINVLIVTDGSGTRNAGRGALINQRLARRHPGVGERRTGARQRPLKTTILPARSRCRPSEPVQLGHTGDVRVTGNSGRRRHTARSP